MQSVSSTTLTRLKVATLVVGALGVLTAGVKLGTDGDREAGRAGSATANATRAAAVIDAPRRARIEPDGAEPRVVLLDQGVFGITGPSDSSGAASASNSSGGSTSASASPDAGRPPTVVDQVEEVVLPLPDPVEDVVNAVVDPVVDAVDEAIGVSVNDTVDAIVDALPSALP